jgi:hypothetical protein
VVRIPVILEAKQKTSVLINGVSVPINSANFSLQRFSRPLLFYNSGSPFEVSVAGTCALIRQEGENFLIATRHQLGNQDTQRDETEVCIALYDDPKSAMPTLLTPSGSARYSFNEPDAKFLEDILILSFVRKDEKHDQLNAQFLQVDSVKCLNEVDPGSIIHFLTIAFPSIGNRPKLTGDGMGYDEFGTGFVRLALELHDIPTLEKHIAFRVKEEPRKERELDGFSGAPVYFLFVDHGEQVHVGWAGIVRLAGNGIFHAYMASEIRQYIRSSRMA